MANKYTRKSHSQIQKPDEFVSFWTTVYDAVSPYGRPIALGSVAFLVVIIGVWVVNRFLVEGPRHEATEELGRALRVYETPLLDESKDKDAKDKEAKDKDKEKDVNEIPRFKTEKERAEAALAEVDKLEKSHGSSGAARQASLLRAGALFDLGRYDEAAAAYKKFLDKTSDDDRIRLVAREGVGLCAELSNRFDEALAAYQEIEKTGGDFYRDRAMYDQARVYGKKGDKAKAAEIYKAILAKTPLTPLKDDINARLAVLEG